MRVWYQMKLPIPITWTEDDIFAEVNTHGMITYQIQIATKRNSRMNFSDFNKYDFTQSLFEILDQPKCIHN